MGGKSRLLREWHADNRFAEVRDQVTRFAAMALEQRPSFHEVRGLGSRIYLAHGMADAASQSLMNPFEPEDAKIYLDGEPKCSPMTTPCRSLHRVRRDLLKKTRSPDKPNWS